MEQRGVFAPGVGGLRRRSADRTVRASERCEWCTLRNAFTIPARSSSVSRVEYSSPSCSPRRCKVGASLGGWAATPQRVAKEIHGHTTSRGSAACVGTPHRKHPLYFAGEQAREAR